jgi:hypothetical protein
MLQSIVYNRGNHLHPILHVRVLRRMSHQIGCSVTITAEGASPTDPTPCHPALGAFSFFASRSAAVFGHRIHCSNRQVAALCVVCRENSHLKSARLAFHRLLLQSTTPRSATRALLASLTLCLTLPADLYQHRLDTAHKDARRQRCSWCVHHSSLALLQLRHLKISKCTSTPFSRLTLLPLRADERLFAERADAAGGDASSSDGQFSCPGFFSRHRLSASLSSSRCR